MSEATTILSLKCPTRLVEALERLAADRLTTRSTVVRQLIQQAVAQQNASAA
jgi:metal-responsive CopG/Arc/MetJ family transcriptional regulator